MIKKDKDWDNISNYGYGEFQSLPKGGYKCRLIKAEETEDRNKRPMVHIAFDIVEGEYTGYFMKLFESRKNRAENPKEVKYPFEGQAWIPVLDYNDDSKQSSKFKGFCTAIEESGADIWTPKGELNLDVVAKAEVGVVFQYQEQEYNGKTSWRAIPWGFRSLETIDSGDFYVPDDKPLNNGNSNGNYSFPNPVNSDIDVDSFSAAEDSIPF